MPIEQLYFMYGFGICFVVSVIVFFINRSAHNVELQYHIGMRQIEADAIRHHYENQIELLAQMKGYEKISIDNRIIANEQA